ncbi:hypothetical protein N7491_005423 [Penicillium cf. griseofulvum]|uniref:Uncharacterized protein n=1 Tax=Penicillium cf. griseofulvum TaxID=2972120 RepID=A0A9W9M541_9EURO|nr:hypothetical protein N7472_008113 [Penicillium cf. griseofulvum]KAJ5434828.1 hypothetical protein N7491_005423 [Penicillium cf. griseofulvum]KAJ5452660.1 hypothetical protein N7445_000843 [Penicillium cf. griseofulvum]
MNRLYASRIGILPYEALFEKRNTKLDPYIEEVRLIVYNEGDNYVLYNVRTKKIERSRNYYLIRLTTSISKGWMPEIIIMILIGIFLLISLITNLFIALILISLDNQPTSLRFGTPLPPIVEDDPDNDLFGLASPPLDPSNPAILEE